MPGGRPTRQQERDARLRVEVPRIARSAPAQVKFRAALELLLPPPIPRAALEELFEKRVGYWTIQDWRKGRIPPPQWARDLINEKISALLS